jgi:3-deoxy-D-manno-octulosonic-acid transferase
VARQHYGDHTLFYFPLDFSWAVRRAMRRIRPDLVVLAELELWPNFILAGRHSGARIAVINGRMSPRSRRGYARFRFLMRRLLARVDAFAVQNADYAQCFADIGAPADRVEVTGSVKYDGVETDRDNPRGTALRRHFGLRPDEVVWVAGSTSEPEEQIVLDAYQQLHVERPKLRLIVVPRHKERFEEVARLISAKGFSFVRRSQMDADGPLTRAPLRPVILVDTLGELSAVWGLADIAFVGGSFAPRGGQNMIEPAGYGAAVLFGPGVWNFQDTVNHLLACQGAIQVASEAEMVQEIRKLLLDSNRRSEVGAAARCFVLSQHGATARTVEILDRLLGPAAGTVRHAA